MWLATRASYSTTQSSPFRRVVEAGCTLAFEAHPAQEHAWGTGGQTKDERAVAHSFRDQPSVGSWSPLPRASKGRRRYHSPAVWQWPGVLWLRSVWRPCWAEFLPPPQLLLFDLTQRHTAPFFACKLQENRDGCGSVPQRNGKGEGGGWCRTPVAGGSLSGSLALLPAASGSLFS